MVKHLTLVFCGFTVQWCHLLVERERSFRSARSEVHFCYWANIIQ